jgi:NAD(P)H-dependent flavin oxidoreductase YrpB (nitropropane dioxygenase family)
VWLQVASVEGALGALDRDVDALIAQGSESGGHLRGVYEGRPVPRSELVPQVVAVAGGRLVLAAGGITNGEGLAEALREGADGAWVGTRFAASLESHAHDEYKRRVVAASKKDIVTTTMFGPEWPDVATTAIRNRVVNEWAGREDQIPTPPPPPLIIGTTLFAGAPYAMPKFSAVLPTRDTSGDFEEMWFTAGGVSAQQVKDVKSAAEIVAEMGSEARSIIEHTVLSGA